MCLSVVLLKTTTESWVTLPVALSSLSTAGQINPRVRVFLCPRRHWLLQGLSCLLRRQAADFGGKQREADKSRALRQLNVSFTVVPLERGGSLEGKLMMFWLGHL